MSVELDAKSKQDFVAKQFREAMYQEGKTVQEVTCGCGLTMPLRFAYKCLYCGEFYCQSCAEQHFGKTREQYSSDKTRNGNKAETMGPWTGGYHWNKETNHE